MFFLRLAVTVAEQSNLPKKILVVDDDLSVGQGLEQPMQAYGVSVSKAKDLQTALYLFNTQRFDVVLVEIEFKELPGLALVQKWRAHEIMEKRCTGFIMMTGDIYIAKDAAGIKLRPHGILSDIAPTVLALLGLPKPKDMTSETLIQGRIEA